MNSPRLVFSAACSFFFLLVFSVGDRSCGMSPATPVQRLEGLVLAKDLVLKNSPGIYFDLEEACRREGMLQKRFPDWEPNIGVAWKENPKADALKITITLPQGISLREALERIAKKRGELVAGQNNYVLIRLPGAPPLLKSYRTDIPDDPPPNAAANPHLRYQIFNLVVTSVPRPFIHLERLKGETVGEFLDELIKETMVAPNEKIRVKFNKPASEAAEKINVFGAWTYGDLFDAYAALGNLRWEVGTDTITFVEFSSKAKEKSPN